MTVEFPPEEIFCAVFFADDRHLGLVWVYADIGVLVVRSGWVSVRRMIFETYALADTAVVFFYFDFWKWFGFDC